MQRYLLEISYNGSSYFGWQIQPNQKTIQGELNEKLTLLLSEEINLIGCGRTDTGVHAVQFFAHFDLKKKINIVDFKFKINNFLSPFISVNKIFLVNQDFHARFSAISRTYEYWISTEKDPFLIQKTHLFLKSLDIDLFNFGSQYLIGKKDFSSFCKSKVDLQNKYCNVMEATCFKSKNMYIFRIKANRFLHNMVRSIVGTLLDFSCKKINQKDLEKIIKDKDRKKAGASVPAQGLYLMNVEYPKNSFSEKNI
tara:strand:+ start:1195 stop:1953 length:759 start_codon:yes stop_codon:yes gene_type:complete